MSKSYAVPIVCLTDGCEGRGTLLNVVSGINGEDIDDFYESYDASCLEDYCRLCGELGVAYDAIAENILSHIHKQVDWQIPVRG